MAVEGWKKDIAEDYIKENILLKNGLNNTPWSILHEINNIRNKINSLKNFDILWSENTWNDNENTWLDEDDMLWLNNVMGILFNNQWNQRGEMWYELKKSANIFLSEEDKKSLDLLYESLKKANTEEELKNYLWKELDNLQSDVEWNADSNEDSNKDPNEDSNKDLNKDSNVDSNENSTEETKSDSNTECNTDSNQNTDVLPEIDNASVEEIAHLWAENWDTRQLWETLKVNKKKRKKFLFPDDEPKTAAEMESKYLSKITVPTIDKNWNEKNITLRVHKKLVDNYKAIFKELKDKWIKVDSSSTAAYNWRKIRKWNRLSDHSFWSAIDLNWSYNWWVYWKTDKNSDYYNNQTTVEIFKKYWFARWWDWWKKRYDPMHFTYMWW